MTKLAPTLIATLLAGAAFAPAHAADGVATLRVDGGSVMTSTGGEFVTAQTGAQLADGTRLMVTEGASATVIYADQCTEQYTAPGVYAVDADCKAVGAVVADGAVVAGGTVAGATDLAAVGQIAAGVGVGAAIIDNMDEIPAQPASR